MLKLTGRKRHEVSNLLIPNKHAERELPGLRNDLQGAIRNRGRESAIARYPEVPADGFRSAEELVISLSAYMRDVDIAGDIRNIVKLRSLVNQSYLDEKTRKAYHEELDRLFHIVRK